MFLSAKNIEKNKAAGLGVAGRLMDSESPAAPELRRASSELGILQRARRRFRPVDSEKAAA